MVEDATFSPTLARKHAVADTGRIIGGARERTHRENPQATSIAQRSFEMALRQSM